MKYSYGSAIIATHVRVRRAHMQTSKLTLNKNERKGKQSGVEQNGVEKKSKSYR